MVACASLLAAAPARADTAPWAVGVSDARKAKAKQFLDAGNARMLEKNYTLALDNYNAAVAQWEHPAIRFNLVRCLIQLDKLAEASENLKLALKYGAAPLEDQIYNEALAYEKLLAKQIAELTVSCTQPGVTVTLDGQPIASCPFVEKRRVKPGPHQVVGTKSGLLTRTIEVFSVGGATQDVAVRLDPLASAATIEQWSDLDPAGARDVASETVGGEHGLRRQRADRAVRRSQRRRDPCRSERHLGV